MSEAEQEFDRRARTREIQSEFAARGDALGWFDALYQEAAGDNEKIPWADLEPNRYLVAYAKKVGLKGDGRKALVIGCGLGDDARYLDDLGFKVTAFDISPTAIEWARRLHENRNIKFEVADLFEIAAERKNPVATAPGSDIRGGFDFVLEVYTIQPLPLEMREATIDAVASFVAPGGELLVVTRGREDNEVPDELPWPVSRQELSRFEAHGMTQTFFEVMPGDDETPQPRFVVTYKK